MSATSNGQQNGSLSYDSFGGKVFTKTESHFLWWCAGAHQQLLKDYPSEHTKYAGLGGVLLATFVLASLSAGYAIYSVFDNVVWAFAFAIIWGLIIFNFDRFLVSTMRKYGVSKSKQFWIALPRIILALLIGITIARPLELKIFEKEINTKVAENRHHKILLNDSLLQAENKTFLLNIQQERTRLLQRKLLIEDTLHRLQEAYIQEADGTGGSLHRGVEKLTLLKQQAYNSALQQFTPELQQLANQINYQDSILNNTQANNEIKRKQYEEAVTANGGFLERNKALSDLSAQEGSVFWSDFFISLLIILIETGPILSKLIMTVGPYDVALAKTELLQMATSENEMRRDKELLFDKLNGCIKRKKKCRTILYKKFLRFSKSILVMNWKDGKEAKELQMIKLRSMSYCRKIKNQYDFKEENIL